jgi:hypothetical protein
MTKKRDDRGNAGMADGSADVNGESEVGSDVDAATDDIIPSQSHRQPRLLGATSWMSTIRRRHVFRYSSYPLWCLLFLGPTIPHPAKNDEAKESWNRGMRILFKP